MSHASGINWKAITAGVVPSDLISHIMDVACHGHPERGTMAVIASIDAFLDESSDQNRKDVYSVAAFISSNNNWKALQDDWSTRLDQDNIEYFHTASCKKVDGPFLPLRQKYGFERAQQKATQIREDLENILLGSDRWCWFGLCIVVPEYDAVLQAFPPARQFFAEDCTIAAYRQTMCEITLDVRKRDSEERSKDSRHPNHSVAFFVDDSSMSEKICRAFIATKKDYPDIAGAMATCAPLNDKVTPPLQMTDLLASITKDAFLKWVSIGKPVNGFQLEPQWAGRLIGPIGIWTKEHMVDVLAKTISDPRLRDGTLLRQTDRIAKSERKQLRKEMTKRRGYTGK
jgi:hypothetical protein